MNEKTIYLAMAISFAVMGRSGIVPLLILSAIYFYVFFTYDANERKKEENRKSWLQNREREDKEKARIAKIRYDEGMAEIEKSKQERLQGIQKRQAEETERAIKRQQFSYVYVLSNSSMSGILKIGYTDNDPISRANELSNSTGVPTPYRVIREYPFATPARAKAEEKRLHSVFKKQRVNLKREFFRVSVEEVESKVRGYIKDAELQPTAISPKPAEKKVFISTALPRERITPQPKVEAIRTETHTVHKMNNVPTVGSQEVEKMKKRFIKHHTPSNKPATVAKQQRKKPTEVNQRILCSDGNCIGILDEDGYCKECGKDSLGKLMHQPNLQIGSLTLCSGSNCIGTIGRDGKCNRCGKSQARN